MASPARRSSGDLEAPAPLLKLTDDLLADILIHLPAPADLARASAACPTFRRVIADHSFLRRFRALHPPPLLGVLCEVCGVGLLPAQPPHPSAAAARAVADAADFTWSFIPSPDRWRCRDIREGRALLSRVPKRCSNSRALVIAKSALVVKELAVCDILHRRYLLLPAIPDEFAALIDELDILRFEPFLAPSSEDERGTSFRVICLAHSKIKLAVFSFSSGSGQWHASEFDGWSALTAGPGNPSPFPNPELHGRSYAHKCFCWMIRGRNKLLVLATHTMEFSSINIPPADPWQRLVIVEAGEGRFGMLTPHFDMESQAFVLSYMVFRSDGHANQWQSEAKIRLPLGLV
ncbi:unnamed protein product [Urochloa humidicola]